MDKKSFWKVIIGIKHLAQENSIPRSQLLLQHLASLQAEQIAAFDLMMRALIDRAGSQDMWLAAKILNGGHCSDDVFLYFRAWLISEGEDIYYAAISSPDSLAELEIDNTDGSFQAEDEDFYFSATDACHQITGKSIHANTQASSNSENNRAPGFHIGGEVDKLLPRLWRKYGRLLDQDAFTAPLPEANRFDKEIREKIHVRHRKYGEGFIESIMTGPPDVAFVRFGNDVRPIALDSGHLEQMDRSDNP